MCRKPNGPELTGTLSQKKQKKQSENQIRVDETGLKTRISKKENVTETKWARTY
jgi:hypothetical protein